MNTGDEVERYVKDPSLLIELWRKVIERLDSGSDAGKNAAKEAQLREISRAIDKLEKQGVPVPDVLRAEKTRLAAAWVANTEALQTLNQLAGKLEELLKDIRARISQNLEIPPANRPRLKRSKHPKTEKVIFRQLIIEILKSKNGRAKVTEVLDQVGERLKGKFLPGDLELRQDGKTLVWRNNAQWERWQMVQDGVLRSDSPNGIWELSEGYR